MGTLEFGFLILDERLPVGWGLQKKYISESLISVVVRGQKLAPNCWKIVKLKRVCFRVFSNFEILQVLRKCLRGPFYPSFLMVARFQQHFWTFRTIPGFIENFQSFRIFLHVECWRAGVVFTFLTVFFQISGVKDAFHHLFERFAPFPGFLKFFKLFQVLHVEYVGGGGEGGWLGTYWVLIEQVVVT